MSTGTQVSTKPKRRASHRRKLLSESMKRYWANLPLDAECRKCSTPVAKRWLFCRGCWTSVSDEHKAAINAAFDPHFPLRDQPDPAYWTAIEAAL